MSATHFAGRVRIATGLSVSTSLLALGLVAAAPAAAQEAETNAPDTPIVVTGTRIEGVAPVGSAVIPVDREAMAKIGASTTNDALRKLPQVVNFGGSDEQAGGTTIQNSSLNTFFAKSVNLRGLGTAATLSLVNNHRVAPQGPNGQLYDADNIPGIAIERIEVVADGGSAIYGSDAIGGVVNYIMRRPENVIEGRFRAGFADGVEEYIGSVALGRTWGSGGIVLAYEYQDRSALKAADRPNLFNDDLSPFGGALSPALASPGNVTIGGVNYGVPTGQNGTGVTLGSLTSTVNRMNQWTGADAIPAYHRHSVSGNFTQDLGPSVVFNLDGFYSRRDFERHEPAQVGTLNVPANNPFSPCYVGKPDNSLTLDCPAGGTISVPYSFINDLGNPVNKGYEALWAISGGFDIELGDRFKANLTGYYSEDQASQTVTGYINNNGLRRVLGETVAGTAKPADVAFFNPFCDGNAFDCNSAATIGQFSAFQNIASKYELYGGTASINGSLFDIGGGAVRMAVGGEYHHDVLTGNGQRNNTRSDNVGVITGIPASNQREVSSAYAELFVPLFGAGNAVPGIDRLELNAAVRYDHYSDVGSTTNPKFGINYSPVPGVTFRGSYGTSFRAPSLVDVNKYATAGFLIRNVTGSAVGLTPGNNTFTFSYPAGGNPNLKPETAKTWSLGFDVGPQAVPNLQFSATYYNVVYENKIDTAAYNVPIGAALSSGYYDDFIVYNPLFFPGKSSVTIDQFVSYWNTITSDPLLPILGPIPGNDPRNLIAIVDARRNNTGLVKTDGIDFNLNYTIPAGSADFRVGLAGNYTFHYKTAPVPAAPLADEVNNFGYPAQFTGRIELGVDVGGFSGTAFINHVNGRNMTRAFLPAGVSDEYLKIDAYTTVDLTLRYNFEDTGSMFTDGLGFGVSVLNLFDKDPPLVVNAGASAPSIRYDPSYSGAVGRFIAFEISKSFR